MRLAQYAKDHNLLLSDVQKAAKALQFDSAHPYSKLRDVEISALDRHFAGEVAPTLKPAAEPPVVLTPELVIDEPAPPASEPS